MTLGFTMVKTPLRTRREDAAVRWFHLDLEVQPSTELDVQYFGPVALNRKCGTFNRNIGRGKSVPTEPTRRRAEKYSGTNSKSKWI